MKALVRTLLAFTLLGSEAIAAPIVTRTLNASLNTGSLAGTMFPVSFGYDPALVDSSGYGPLSFFNFTLLGTSFTLQNISQGGQVIVSNGSLMNVTASFQGVLPAGSPVNNVTFGFGGPGIIGYIGTTGAFGQGSFTFSAAVVTPEPGTLTLVLSGCLLASFRRKKGGYRIDC